MTPLNVADCLPYAIKMLKRRCGYETYERYYNGVQRLAYATEKWRSIFGRIFARFADNVCRSVVDAVADRLEIIGFEVKGEGDGTEAAHQTSEGYENQVQAVWEDNRMDYNAGRVHTMALRDGDAYVLVWPDLETNQPVITPQPAGLWRVKYDSETPGRMLYAVKAWITEEKRCRLNIYLRDGIYKFISGRKAEQIPERVASFVKFDAAAGNDADTTWPVANPYDMIPVFHFANDASVGEYGRSELQDVLPLQDAVNKAVLDLLAAMEYQALPQRWAAGLDVEIDPDTGKPIPPFEPGTDVLWTVADEKVQFGQFAAGDLEQLVKVGDSLRMEVARVTGTPLHYVMLLTDPPSGEALKALEARLLKKVRDRQMAFGNTWSDVMQFVSTIIGLPETVRFEPKWKDPAPKSELEHAQTLTLKKALGVPRDQILTELDYSPAQIEEFQSMREEELASVGASLLDQMANGNLQGNGAPPSGGAGGGNPPNKTNAGVTRSVASNQGTVPV
jgi:hypothetical protein